MSSAFVELSKCTTSLLALSRQTSLQKVSFLLRFNEGLSDDASKMWFLLRTKQRWKECRRPKPSSLELFEESFVEISRFSFLQFFSYKIEKKSEKKFQTNIACNILKDTWDEF